MRQILIVDDEPAVLKATMRVLERYIPDVRVNAASTGDDALILIEANEYDLVISDVTMPDMNGFELQERVRALPDRSKLADKFIFYSGGTPEPDMQERLQKAPYKIIKGSPIAVLTDITATVLRLQ